MRSRSKCRPRGTPFRPAIMQVPRQLATTEPSGKFVLSNKPCSTPGFLIESQSVCPSSKERRSSAPNPEAGVEFCANDARRADC